MKKKIDFYSKENPEGVDVPYASYEYELMDEKCKDCKHADTNDTHCVNCTHRFEPGTLRFDLAGDYFEPKEEQPTTEYKGCDGCYYEWLGESDAPCCDCKYRFDQGTMAHLKAKDCFKSNEEKADDEIDMVNHPEHYSARGIDPIDYIESHNFNFNLGNVIKYVSRASYKGTEL